MQAKMHQTATVRGAAVTEAARCVVVLATGGTIAGLSHGRGDNDYDAAQVPVGELLQSATPGTAAGARSVEAGAVAIEAEQVAQIDSKDMSHEVWRALAARCRFHLERQEVLGIVITHGTDTMEETAYFLHRVLAPQKPVVLTGAMRPADAGAPDGPGNMAEAILVAQHPAAHGVLVAMASEVHAADWVRKVHPHRLQAFSSAEHPLVARWVEHALRFGEHENQHSINEALSRHAIGPKVLPALPWPRVDIVFSHAGANGDLLNACVAAGARGIVIAATGNATVHQALTLAAERAVAQGVLVLRATRCSEGDCTRSASVDVANRANLARQPIAG